MAHFAQLDENNTVVQVIVVSNNEILDNGVESEAKGIAFCESLFGGSWVQTSYSGSFRKRYAGVGFIYDRERDAFLFSKPYQSWILDEVSLEWVAPVPLPVDYDITTKPYSWDEAAQVWVAPNFVQPEMSGAQTL
jgi:hypothetical protein